MIFRYTTLEGEPKSVDTDSVVFVNRIAWMEQWAPKNPKMVFGFNISPVAVGGNPTSEQSVTQTGSLLWRTEESVEEFTTDVYLTFIAPKVALNEILKFFGWPPYVGPEYSDPKPEAPLEDWQVTGARIGPPFPGQPGKWQSRLLGNNAGDRWEAPSGNVYEFVLKFSPFGTDYWKRV